MTELLTWLYPWMKTLHIISVMSWMAGLLYLPRLMVYHTENAIIGGEMDATWLFGILLSLTPYVIDWQQIWPWVKLLSIILLTGFHHWLGARSKDFVLGKNRISGRQFRLLNEVPTILMIIIVASVVVKY